MKPLIGIINRQETLESGNKIEYCYKEIINKIIKSNGIPLGISIVNIEDTLNIIDGIIIQGGNTYNEKELEIIKYAYNNDIPLLGICQGMQMIGLINGELRKIKNHNHTTHNVFIKNNTKLYEILKKEKITVNSRHNYALVKTNHQISGISEDDIIEAIEDKEKKFFIGVEWHPESLNNEDSNNLFDYFIKKSKEGKKWL